MKDDMRYWSGLVAGICLALVGQAEVIPEPYRHYVSVVGIVATVISGYRITPSGSVKG